MASDSPRRDSGNPMLSRRRMEGSVTSGSIVSGMQPLNSRGTAVDAATAASPNNAATFGGGASLGVGTSSYSTSRPWSHYGKQAAELGAQGHGGVALSVAQKVQHRMENLKFPVIVAEPTEPKLYVPPEFRRYLLDDPRPTATQYGLELHRVCTQGVVSAFQSIKRLYAAYFRGQQGPAHATTAILWPRLSEVSIHFAACAYHAEREAHRLLELAPPNCRLLSVLRSESCSQLSSAALSRLSPPWNAQAAMASLHGHVLRLQCYGTGLATILRSLETWHPASDVVALRAILGFSTSNESPAAEGHQEEPTTLLDLAPAAQHAVTTLADLLAGMEICREGRLKEHKAESKAAGHEADGSGDSARSSESGEEDEEKQEGAGVDGEDHLDAAHEQFRSQGREKEAGSSHNHSTSRTSRTSRSSRTSQSSANEEQPEPEGQALGRDARDTSLPHAAAAQDHQHPLQVEPHASPAAETGSYEAHAGVAAGEPARSPPPPEFDALGGGGSEVNSTNLDVDDAELEREKIKALKEALRPDPLSSDVDGEDTNVAASVSLPLQVLDNDDDDGEYQHDNGGANSYSINIVEHGGSENSKDLSPGNAEHERPRRSEGG